MCARPFRRLDSNGVLQWDKIKSLDKGRIYKQVCYCQKIVFLWLVLKPCILGEIGGLLLTQSSKHNICESLAIRTVKLPSKKYNVIILFYSHYPCLVDKELFMEHKLNTLLTVMKSSLFSHINPVSARTSFMTLIW